jgi:hypothetical protein
LPAEFAKGAEIFLPLDFFFLFPNDFSIQYDKILAPIEMEILPIFLREIEMKSGKMV